MKFKVASGKTEWFKGQITKYDGLTGKYGIYFPCDGETVLNKLHVLVIWIHINVYPNDKDMKFV